MAKALSREDIARRIEQGRGQGEGAQYQPWLSVRDVPSLGLSSVIPGWKTGRQHVVFSKRERGAFFIAQWLESVVDIREQYPLLPLEETEEIASGLGVIHPRVNGMPQVMTTDFLLTRTGEGKQHYEAWAVKPVDKLENKRVQEKLEIERLYWNRRGVIWKIVTERELPQGFVENLNWFDGYRELSDETVRAIDVPRLEEFLFSRILNSPDQPLNSLCVETDHRLGYRPGVSLAVVRHALACKRWRVPMDVAIDTDRPLLGLQRNQGASDEGGIM